MKIIPFGELFFGEKKYLFQLCDGVLFVCSIMLLLLLTSLDVLMSIVFPFSFSSLSLLCSFFSGIMFNIENHSKQPLEYLEIQSLCVRGDLGPITVWVTSLSYYNKHEDKKQWTLVYRGTHEPSRLNYCPLILQRPIRLEGGERIGIYIHSGLGGDQGLVYDNRHGDVTMSDENLSVQSGMAHVRIYFIVFYLLFQ